jgi:hypothetical protein
MTILATRQPKAKRAPKQRTFSVLFRIDGVDYILGRTPAHPEIAQAAFSVRKLIPDGETYHVRVSPEGWLACDCRGHERWGHCKHASCIQAAAKLFDLTPAQPKATDAVPQGAEADFA